MYYNNMLFLKSTNIEPYNKYKSDSCATIDQYDKDIYLKLDSINKTIDNVDNDQNTELESDNKEKSEDAEDNNQLYNNINQDKENIPLIKPNKDIKKKILLAY